MRKYNDVLSSSVLDSVANEVSPCAGLPPDSYDRYVLGLLDKAERAHVERELAQQCPACVAGVQRSINLWLVFAGSLEQVEPSADFRGRLIRIAELSNRVLTVPKRYKRKPAILFSSLVVICLILGMLLFFTFLAGQQSARLEVQRVKLDLANLDSKSVENLVKLNEESARNKEIEEKLSHPSSGASSRQMQDELARLRADNVKFQAVVENYQASVDRDKERSTDNSKLVSALENPGVKLLTFKTPEGASSTAYAFVIENSKVLFVASKLPPPPDQRRYQLWLVRKRDRSFVSLGLFTMQADVPEVPAVINYDQDQDSIADLAGLVVTEEPITGSTQPSATRVLETPGAAAAATTPAPPAEAAPAP